MVGPLLLLKMLHCKEMCRKKSSKGKNKKNINHRRRPSCSETSGGIKVEENQSEEITNMCRVCLKEGRIPIYGNDTTEDISEALNTFGAIDIQVDDVYPKYLCNSCHALLQGAILFRKTAQQSDQILRQPSQNMEIMDNDDDMLNINSENMSDSEEEKERGTKKSKHFHCKRCSLDFMTFKDYHNHRLSQEHENMRHCCPICNKTYTALYFKKHLALHKLETPYMCDICGKKFIVQGQFTRHRLTHFYDLPFKCSLCPYRGRFTESLKMHMRTHTGEKPYQCTQCPSRFISKSNLNKHMLTHKSEHDFKCEACGRGFYTKRNLELHFKVDHTGIKDHVCNLCGKAFGYRKQMMKHQLKVHKREKLRSGRMPLYLQVESMRQQDDI